VCAVVFCLQLPFQLGRACVLGLQQPARNAVIIAVDLLNFFFHNATVLDYEGELQDSIRQQLEESGFVANSSQLLLQASAALTAPPCTDQVQPPVDSSTGAASATSRARGRLADWTFTSTLLFMWEWMQSRWCLGAPWTSLATASAPALLQLISTAWQLISREVQVQQAPPQPHLDLMVCVIGLSLQALKTLLVNWSTACSEDEAHFELVSAAHQLLDTPHFLPCLGLFQAATVFGVQVPEPVVREVAAGSWFGSTTCDSSTTQTGQPQVQENSGPTAGHSQGTGSTNTPSSTTGDPGHSAAAAGRSVEGIRPSRGLLAWQHTQRMQPSLTASDYRLFSLLGTNGRAVLWAAVIWRVHTALDGRPDRSWQLHSFEVLMPYLTHFRMLHLKGALQLGVPPSPVDSRAAGSSASCPQQPELQPEVQLHVQLASLQIRYAGHTLQRLCGTALGEAAVAVILAGFLGVQLWRFIVGEPSVTDILSTMFEYDKPLRAGSREARTAAAAGEIVQELLPQVLQVLGKLTSLSSGLSDSQPRRSFVPPLAVTAGPLGSHTSHTESHTVNSSSSSSSTVGSSDTSSSVDGCLRKLLSSAAAAGIANSKNDGSSNDGDSNSNADSLAALLSSAQQQQQQQHYKDP